jgi:hypothetical protein
MVLDEIIALAADDKTRLTVLLRQCLVLAHLLKNERLKAWVQHELNGYQDESDLPAYRKIAADAKGNFAGPFHSAWNGWPVPAIVLEERHQQFAQTVMLIQAIAAYEEALQTPNDGHLTFPWPNILTAYYRSASRTTRGWFSLKRGKRFRDSPSSRFSTP